MWKNLHLIFERNYKSNSCASLAWVNNFIVDDMHARHHGKICGYNMHFQYHKASSVQSYKSFLDVESCLL